MWPEIQTYNIVLHLKQSGFSLVRTMGLIMWSLLLVSKLVTTVYILVLESL
jgi:hypothetical protein